MNFSSGGVGSQFFSVTGAKSDEYRESSSDERRGNEKNWPQPEGFHPVAEGAGDPGVAAKRVPGTHLLGQNAACAKVNSRL